MVRLDDVQWRVWWRRMFASFLVLALVVGLYLSFRPAQFDEEPELAGGEATTEPPATTQQPSPEPAEQEDEQEGAAEETEEPEDEGLTQEEIDALIEAARDPAETSVQVLDAGSGGATADEVAELLQELGYDVIAVNPARQEVEVTTVLFTEGNEAEAEALRAREQRIVEVAPNELLSDAVDLHVAVGPDWS